MTNLLLASPLRSPVISLRYSIRLLFADMQEIPGNALQGSSCREVSFLGQRIPDVCACAPAAERRACQKAAIQCLRRSGHGFSPLTLLRVSKRSCKPNRECKRDVGNSQMLTFTSPRKDTVKLPTEVYDIFKHKRHQTDQTSLISIRQSC